MLHGIDIDADDQGHVNWSMVRESGQVDWVTSKATEGLTIQVPGYYAYHNGCAAVRIPYGAYHFFRPRDDGKEQAHVFLDYINGYEGQVLPMVDVEVIDDVDKDAFLARLTDFIETVDSTLRGKKMLIYFKYSLWRDFLGGYDGFAGHGAWPAAYNNDATLDMTGTGWASWTIWQWSDGASMPNIPGFSTNVDRDRLNSNSLAGILR